MTKKPVEHLTYGQMLEAFRRMGQKFMLEEKEGQLIIAGGAAMCLVHGARPSTKDVDAFYEDSNTMSLISYEVGEEFGWEPGWLNNAMSCFIHEVPASEHFITFPGLKVFTVTPEHLLGLKLAALRPLTKDAEDAALLISKLGYRSTEEVEKALDLASFHKGMTGMARKFLDSYFAQLGEKATEPPTEASSGSPAP